MRAHEWPINNKSVTSIMGPFLRAKKLKLAGVQAKFLVSSVAVWYVLGKDVTNYQRY